MAGLDRERIFRDIREAIPQGTRTVPDREILDAVRRARKVKQDLYARWLVPLGADRSCAHPSRLSRLPGHIRRDTGMC